MTNDLCTSCGEPLSKHDKFTLCEFCFDVFASEPDSRLRNKLLDQYAIEREEVKA